MPRRRSSGAQRGGGHGRQRRGVEDRAARRRRTGRVAGAAQVAELPGVHRLQRRGRRAGDRPAPAPRSSPSAGRADADERRPGAAGLQVVGEHVGGAPAEPGAAARVQVVPLGGEPFERRGAASSGPVVHGERVRAARRRASASGQVDHRVAQLGGAARRRRGGPARRSGPAAAPAAARATRPGRTRAAARRRAGRGPDRVAVVAHARQPPPASAATRRRPTVSAAPGSSAAKRACTAGSRRRRSASVARRSLDRRPTGSVTAARHLRASASGLSARWPRCRRAGGGQPHRGGRLDRQRPVRGRGEPRPAQCAARPRAHSRAGLGAVVPRAAGRPARPARSTTAAASSLVRSTSGSSLGRSPCSGGASMPCGAQARPG